MIAQTTMSTFMRLQPTSSNAVFFLPVLPGLYGHNVKHTKVKANTRAPCINTMYWRRLSGFCGMGKVFSSRFFFRMTKS